MARRQGGKLAKLTGHRTNYKKVGEKVIGNPEAIMRTIMPGVVHDFGPPEKRKIGFTKENMMDLQKWIAKAIVGAGLMMVFASLSRAQGTIAYTFNGDSPVDIFGVVVSDAGDVNGDGFDDLIVGAILDDNNGDSSGSARVFSGLDGAILYTFNGDGPDDLFGEVSGAGDVNNDGYDDLIVGARRAVDSNGLPTGSARVFSGLDGSILYTFYGDSAFDQCGRSVSDAGDVNGDGYDDVIVGAPEDDNNGTQSGSARIFSGFDGSILYTLNGDNAGERFGGSVSGARDVNNDGHADVIVGAIGGGPNPNFAGNARVFSGQNGSVLHTVFGGTHDNFGRAVSGAGDINGDGFADFMVGALDVAFDGTSPGYVRVYSGFDGSTLHSIVGESPGHELGISVSDAGDVNGDGFGDFIIGAPATTELGEPGEARVYSGIDGTILLTIDGDDPDDEMGAWVSGAGDVNGDGFDDLFVGAFGDDNNGDLSGSARVILAPTLPVLKYRTTSDRPHFLDLTWIPDGGNPSALTGSIVCEGATPGGIGLAALSLAADDEVYAGFLPLLIDVNAPNLIDTSAFGYDFLGSMTVPGVSRQNPALAGMHVHIQFFQTTPLVLSSPGLRLEATL